MKVQVIMRVDWERGSGETAEEFNRKLNSMRAHVLRMQTAGQIPRDVLWRIGRRDHKAIALPEASGPNLGAPGLIHEAGKVLRMPFTGLENFV